MAYQGGKAWCSKLDYAKIVAASLCWLLLKQKDATGLLIQEGRRRRGQGQGRRGEPGAARTAVAFPQAVAKAEPVRPDSRADRGGGTGGRPMPGHVARQRAAPDPAAQRHPAGERSARSRGGGAGAAQAASFSRPRDSRLPGAGSATSWNFRSRRTTFSRTWKAACGGASGRRWCARPTSSASRLSRSSIAGFSARWKSITLVLPTDADPGRALAFFLSQRQAFV